MEMNKTTVYTLNREDIQEACYSLFVQKLKGLKINAYFEVGDVKFLDSDDEGIYGLSAELKIIEKENI